MILRRGIVKLITSEFAEAATELIEILNYLPKEEVKKIPKKLIEFFQNISDSKYVTNINPNKSLEEQDIKEKTKDLIAVIYRNYWCDEIKRKELDIKLIENEKILEEKKRELYNPDDIFKKRIKEEKNESEEQRYMIEILEEKWYQKLISKILKIFKIR